MSENDIKAQNDNPYAMFTKGENGEPMLQLLVPVRAVPDGEVVFKKGGTKPYVVRRQLRFFNDPNNPAPLVVDADLVWLMSTANHQIGDINALEAHKEVVWYLPAWKFYDHLKYLEPNEEWPFREPDEPEDEPV